MTEQLTDEQSIHGAPVSGTAAPAGPIRVSWGTVPKVNLLPLEVIQGRRLARTKLMLGGLVITGVVVAGAGVFLAQHQVSDANDDLASAQSQVSSLQAEAAKYSAVPQITAQVSAALSARAQVMGNDILWYQFLNDLDGALPSGVTPATVTAQLTVGNGAQAASNPLASAGVGTLSITGTAGTYNEVSAWLESLAKVNGVSTPLLTSASAGSSTGGEIDWTVAAILNQSALSHRYDQEGN